MNDAIPLREQEIQFPNVLWGNINIHEYGIKLTFQNGSF